MRSKITILQVTQRQPGGRNMYTTSESSMARCAAGFGFASGGEETLRRNSGLFASSLVISTPGWHDGNRRLPNFLLLVPKYPCDPRLAYRHPVLYKSHVDNGHASHVAVGSRAAKFGLTAPIFGALAECGVWPGAFFVLAIFLCPCEVAYQNSGFVATVVGSMRSSKWSVIRFH